jgi:hypothetical protein
VQRATDAVVLYDLMQLAANEFASAQVRATAGAKLNQLRDWAAAQAPADAGLKEFFQYVAAQVKLFESDPKQVGLPRPPAPPPGMPIGDGEPDYVVW